MSTARGLARKESGMRAAATARPGALETAKRVAVNIALRSADRLCHMDMVRDQMPEGIELGPAAGSVFKGKCWEFTGQRIISSHPANNGRELKVWRLRA